ncbi:hypothetical protein MRB53_042016 [Persea americana]|nr:hypothetical protein MRB53_042016 [Persea americana]
MSRQIPSTIRAITIHGTKARLSTIPTPTLRPTYLLAKVDSVALNPTDWKHIAGAGAGLGSIGGCDFAGTVVAVGSDVSKSLAPGDRIAATVHGSNRLQVEDGCFAEYALAKADLVVKLPKDLSSQAAATFPLGVATVGQGLFQKALKLNLPDNPTKSGETVLIYGGSTATGSLAIQFATLAGYRVITTCNPRNNDFVKSLGAQAVYDYNDPECGKKINNDTQNKLRYAWDTISLASSAKICSEALTSSPDAGARYGAILPVKLPREDNSVAQTWTLMYTIFNEPIEEGPFVSPALPEDFAFAKKFSAITEDLLAQGKLKTHPEQVNAKGLEGVLQGLQDLAAGKVSAKKLVYRIDDTQSGVEIETDFKH